jgi:hypothetical protein
MDPRERLFRIRVASFKGDMQPGASEDIPREPRLPQSNTFRTPVANAGSLYLTRISHK